MDDAIAIVDANLADPAHASALVELIDAYMRDPMEGGQPPPDRVRRDLVPGLRAHPGCYVFFAYREASPIGFAICFLGFSTFSARPLINIHDLFVSLAMRRKGVGRRILDRIEAKGHELGCCRITLEVRDENHVARGLYRKSGFSHTGQFWTKPLEPIR